MFAKLFFFLLETRWYCLCRQWSQVQRGQTLHRSTQLVFGLGGSGEWPAATLAAPAHTPPPTHMHTHTHTGLWSAFIVSVRPGGTNKHKRLPSNMSRQTCTHWHTRPHTDKHTHTHALPRAQYRVHYCGMPHCSARNTTCTQTSPGLRLSGLWVPRRCFVCLSAAPSCLRTEWLTNGQDYPGIISYSLCKHSSIIPAELSHSPFAVEWFIQWLHVTRKRCCCCCCSSTELESVHLLSRGGVSLLTRTVGLSSCKMSYNFAWDYRLQSEGKHDWMTSSGVNF